MIMPMQLLKKQTTIKKKKKTLYSAPCCIKLKLLDATGHKVSDIHFYI